MRKRKKTLFEKLTGAVNMEKFDDDILDDENDLYETTQMNEGDDDPDEIVDVGQLSVDVINQPEEIIIKAMIAGVKPHELDVQISRDMITINGTREEEMDIEETDYYHRELVWGNFSRNILLPEEIDVELSTAEEKHGMLEIHLPKIDKDRKTKLQIKSR